jgi:predicted site-specific integrase-resolvase
MRDVTLPANRRDTYNTNQVLEIYDISRASLHRWIKQGKIPEPMTHPVSRQKMWTQSDLENLGLFLERQKREKHANRIDGR